MLQRKDAKDPEQALNAKKQERQSAGIPCAEGPTLARVSVCRTRLVSGYAIAVDTIQTIGHVDAAGRLHVEVQTDAPPGDYELVLLLERNGKQPRRLELTVIKGALADPQARFGRDEIYGDDGR